MSRRSVAWLLTLPLAVVGSQLAHALAYRLATPNDAERGHELAASGHGYLAYLPAVLAVCSVLVALALAGELGHALTDRSRRPSRPSALRFAVLAPAIFACQEHFERLLHDGRFPWNAGFHRLFLVGLLLQLPFALVAYTLARLLLRVARSLGRLLTPPLRLSRVGAAIPRPATCIAVPRVPALALGYGSRGPPALLAA